MRECFREATRDRLLLVVADIATQHGITAQIGFEDSFVDRGMTSMAMVDLMLATEAHFNVIIPQTDLTPTNFQSLKRLALLLDRLQAVHQDS